VWIAWYWELDEAGKRRACVRLLLILAVLGLLLGALWYLQTHPADWARVKALFHR
jgi:hypothetical protein